jgi:transglutaminase superfamily protein
MILSVPPAAIIGLLLQVAPYQFDEAPRQHVEELDAAAHDYEVTLGGTLDGFNTVEYLQTYAACQRIQSKFEPNRYLVVENIGETDVLNPRIVVCGRRDWFSVDSILAGIVTPKMTDAQKAMAIWQFTAHHQVQCHENNRRVGPPHPDPDSHPSRNTFSERANPVKAANCYYCSGCSLAAANFVILCRHADLSARAVWMCPLNTYATHCVGEAWYDGGWHLFDPERRSFYLAEDNTTVASYERLHKNPSLATRTHDGGFASKGMKSHDKDYKEFYPPRVMPVEDWTSSMAMTLRPGEQFIWRWKSDGKFRYGNNPRNRDYPPHQLANGKIVYRPLFRGRTFQRSVVSSQNLGPVEGPNGRGRISPLVATQPGFAVYKVSSPYPIVGGIVGGRFVKKTASDGCRILLATGDSDWRQVWSAGKEGNAEAFVAIDDVLDPKTKPAIYDYYVKFEITAQSSTTDVYIDEIYLETDVQMSAVALPALSLGKNHVTYTDESSGRRVRITHGWEESSATRPPLPPSGPASDATRSPVTLAWQPSRDPDGDAIKNYHVQVSPRRDMRHPVSPNLDRIIGSSEPQWKLPPGWLVKGRTYYWRVRAVDAWGAWSPWSPAWEFTVGSEE